ncbi:hypothetical protein R6Q59_010223 [Mikania micrantha]
MRFQELKQQTVRLLKSEAAGTDELDELEGPYPRTGRRSTRVSRRRTLIVFCTQTILIVALATWSFSQWQKLNSLDQKFQPTYSPAQSAVRLVNEVSISGFGHERSPYSGKPNDANNAAWEYLYDFGLSRIPIESAAKLVNRTVPIPGDPGYYIVSLDVFHELHCLNKIRQLIWRGEPDPDDPAMQMEHIDHCIDMLRQNIMCSSDITPFPFIWNKELQRSRPVGKIQRTCRDFEAVRRWAMENRVHGWDPTIRVEDPLGNMEV